MNLISKDADIVFFLIQAAGLYCKERQITESQTQFCPNLLTTRIALIRDLATDDTQPKVVIALSVTQ